MESLLKPVGLNRETPRAVSQLHRGRWVTAYPLVRRMRRWWWRLRLCWPMLPPPLLGTGSVVRKAFGQLSNGRVGWPVCAG